MKKYVLICLVILILTTAATASAIDIENAVAFLGEAEGISINQETVNRIFEKSKRKLKDFTQTTSL